jgi:xanthine dehydrogenase accessory factor
MSSDIYRSLKSELDKGKKAVVVTLMNDEDGAGDSTRKKIMLTEEQLCPSNTNHHLNETIVNKAQFALETGNLQYFQAANGASILIEPYFPESRLIVLVGGILPSL